MEHGISITTKVTAVAKMCTVRAGNSQQGRVPVPGFTGQLSEGTQSDEQKIHEAFGHHQQLLVYSAARCCQRLSHLDGTIYQAQWVKLSYQIAVIKCHSIEASSWIPYLYALYPGKSHADRVQSLLFLCEFRLRLLDLRAQRS